MLHLSSSAQRELEAICAKYSVERLELFGSATNDTFDERTSDIDLVVTFRHNANLGPWMRDYFSLQADLAHLFARDVDLLESGAVCNTIIQQEIERSRRLLYAA